MAAEKVTVVLLLLVCVTAPSTIESALSKTVMFG
jgi:hypothetical protein